MSLIGVGTVEQFEAESCKHGVYVWNGGVCVKCNADKAFWGSELEAKLNRIIELLETHNALPQVLSSLTDRERTRV